MKVISILTLCLGLNMFNVAKADVAVIGGDKSPCTIAASNIVFAIQEASLVPYKMEPVLQFTGTNEHSFIYSVKRPRMDESLTYVVKMKNREIGNQHETMCDLISVEAKIRK
jgi:hypothetical protein